MITADELKHETFHSTLHLDGDDFYQNHYKCGKYPRFTVIRSGPAGKHAGKHVQRLFVDGVECADLHAVANMLSLKPRPRAERRRQSSRQQRRRGRQGDE